MWPLIFAVMVFRSFDYPQTWKNILISIIVLFLDLPLMNTGEKTANELWITYEGQLYFLYICWKCYLNVISIPGLPSLTYFAVVLKNRLRRNPLSTFFRMTKKKFQVVLPKFGNEISPKKFLKPNHNYNKKFYSSQISYTKVFRTHSFWNEFGYACSVKRF